MELLPTNLYKALIKYRKQHNLTQKQLGILLNTTQSQIANWEHRKVTPTDKTLDKIDRLINSKHRQPSHEISNSLIYYRKIHHLSQAQLGQKLGIVQPRIAEWENDYKTPNFKNLIKIKQLLNNDPVINNITNNQHYNKNESEIKQPIENQPIVNSEPQETSTSPQQINDTNPQIEPTEENPNHDRLTRLFDNVKKLNSNQLLILNDILQTWQK